MWVCVCFGFVMCGCFGNMRTCIYCVLYCLYCVFVLFRLCILFVLSVLEEVIVASFRGIYMILFIYYYCPAAPLTG